MFESNNPTAKVGKNHPFDRDYNRDPNIKVLTRRGSISHGSPVRLALLQLCKA